MALKSKRVSIDFGFGADEFTDRKLVLNSKLIKAENITLNKPKTISKREGYKFSGDETMDGEVIDPPMNIFDYNNNPVIMTQKDAVKCSRFATQQHWYLPVQAQPDPLFAEQILALLKEKTNG